MCNAVMAIIIMLGVFALVGFIVYKVFSGARSLSAKINNKNQQQPQKDVSVYGSGIPSIGASRSYNTTQLSNPSKPPSRSTSHSSTRSINSGTKSKPTETGKFCQYCYQQIPEKSGRWKFCQDSCRELFYEQERRGGRR